MTVYLAGPMTGYPEYNYPLFHAVAADLRAAGREVRNPAENDAGSTGKPWDYYMRLALAQLVECDTIVLLPRWRESRGARLEKHVASQLGMAVEFWDIL